MNSANPTRAEHLAWCKNRALPYCDQGDFSQAMASMAGDLSEHPETQNHAGIELGMLMLFGDFVKTPQQMREFIEGFR